MKNYKKFVSFFLVFVFLFLFAVPSYAETNNDEHLFDAPISNHGPFNISPEVSIQNINFENFEEGKNVLEVHNTSNSLIKYKLTVYLYDDDYNGHLILHSFTINETAEPNSIIEVSTDDVLENSPSFFTRSLKEIEKDVDSYQISFDYSETTKENIFLDKASDYNYHINNYDIMMKVNEDNSFEITETIDADIHEPQHGIFRSIPIYNEIERTDGTFNTVKATISNVTVNQEHSISIDGKNTIIKIGDPDKYVHGEQKYIINYTYNMGKDKNTGFDELYFNLLGTEWETLIKNLTFSITLPKEFDAEKLGFSLGTKGTIGTNDVIYNIEGNKITGRVSRTIEPNEALTVRLELPDQYFVKPSVKINAEQIIYIVICILILIITLLLYFRIKKNQKPVIGVEFHPPEGMNSLEVGHWYKGGATNKAAVSLLIHLANKGYIKIIELPEPDSGFKLQKLKSYDGNIQAEEKFMNGLFGSYDNEVYDVDLENSFYRTISSVKKLAAKNNPNGSLVYKKSSKISRILIKISIIIASIALLFLIMPTATSEPAIILMPLLLLGIPVILITPILKVVFDALFRSIKSNMIKTILSQLTMLFFLGLFMFFLCIKLNIAKEFFLILFDINPVTITMIITAVITLTSSFVISRKIKERPPYSFKVYEKILSFKNFLETAEKDKLEMLVEENPNYFFDILPYAYVLGVSEKWISRFETIAINTPEWSSSSGQFDITRFTAFSTNVLHVAERTMTSRPSSSGSSGGGSGSSGGGGGSSGGGSGGGGGGTW